MRVKMKTIIRLKAIIFTAVMVGLISLGFADERVDFSVKLEKTPEILQFRANFTIWLKSNPLKPIEMNVHEEIPFHIDFCITGDKIKYSVRHKQYGGDRASIADKSREPEKLFIVDILGDYAVSTGKSLYQEKESWSEYFGPEMIPFRDFARGKSGILTLTLEKLYFMHQPDNIIIIKIPWDGKTFDISKAVISSVKNKQ